MFVTDRKFDFVGTRARRGNAGWLCLIAALSVVAAGCAVGESALPLLPPAPVFSSGTFAVANNFPACPAGSTPANPGGQQCSIANATATVDVLTDAFLGSTYTTTITTRGGTIPVTSCQIQGALPAGVALSASPAGGTCVITGTFPLTLAGIPPGGFITMALTVRATDSGNPAAADTQDVIIRIFAGFTFTTAVLENGTQGRTYTKIVTSNLGGGIGSPPMTACTTTPALPTGLSIAPVGNNCRITGTPTVNGTFNVTVNGTDSATNTRSSAVYTLVINAPLVVTAPALTNGTVGRPYTITVASTAATTGGQRPLTTCSATGLPAGMTIARNAANTACEISGTPTAAGAFTVVVSATDTATTDPAQGGAIVTPAGTSAAAGAALTINPVLAVPAFVIGNGTQGRAFTLSVPSTGGNQPLTACSATGLAAGMTIGVDPGNTSNCLIGGTPTTAGSLSVTVSATDTATANTVAGTAASAATPLTVNAPLTVPAFTLLTGVETVAYSSTVPTSGGNRPLTVCNATGLPTGMTITPDPANTAVNINNCLIGGTPAASTAGPYSVVVNVTDTASTTTAAGNAASASTALTINGPLTIPPYTLGNGTVGRAFQQDVPVTGGIQPLTACAETSGTFAAVGLTIAPSPVPGNCRISGSPTTVAVVVAINITATDTGAPPTTLPVTAAQAGTISINAALTITTVANTVLDAVVGRAGYTLAFANAGGQTTFSWGSAGLGAGACSGMTLSAAGVLTGTPTAAGTCNFTASVTDTATTSTAAGTTNGNFALTVRPEFTVTQLTVVDGVEARTYGNAPLIQEVTTNALAVAGPSDFAQAENGNGPLATCAVTSVVLSAGTPSTPLTTANFTSLPDPTNASRCRLESAGAFPVGSAATYRVTVTATDNPIAAVGVPAGSQSGTVNFIVQPGLTLTETGVGASPFPDAVNSRSYGVGNTCGPTGTAACLAPTYTATGGLGTYTFSGELSFPAGFTCSAAGVNPRICSAANVTAPAGGPVVTTISVADGSNTAVPAGNASVVVNITVQAALAVAANPAVNPPPDAVQGRSYGAAGFTPLTYTATGGIPAYTFPAIAAIGAPGAGVPASVACTPAAAVLTCQTAGAGVVAATAGAYTFNVSVNDTPNASVPSGNAALGAAQTINVLAALSLGINQGDPLNGAVRLRSFGVGLCGGLPCDPVILTASGGLGAFNFVAPALSATPGLGVAPSSFVCGVVGPVLTCSTASVTDAAGLYSNFVFSVNDVANATTPSAVASTTNPTVTRSITVNPELTWGINLTQAGPPATFTAGGAGVNNVTVPLGVEGRPYGPSTFDPTRTPLIYTATGGLPGYGFNSTNLAAFPLVAGAGFFCNGVAGPGTVLCDTNNGSAVPTAITFPAGSAGTYVYNINVTDTNNTSVPAVTIHIDTSLTVNLPISQTTAPSSPLPDARQNSAYGTGAGCSGGACVPVTFTVSATSGLGSFTFGSANFPTGITCTPAANVFTCSAASVTGAPGPYTPIVGINDVANVTTPDHVTANAGVPFTVNENLTVVAPLSIPALPAGTFDGTAGRIFNQQLPFTGGIASFTCSSTGLPTANLAASFGGVDCQVTGTPLGADVGGPFPLNVTVTDSNNTTTPTSSASTGVMPLNINAALTITTLTLPGAASTLPYGVAPTSAVAIAGGEPPHTWSITTLAFFAAGAIQGGQVGTSCEGLTFNTATGAFGGTPVTPGSCGPFTVDVNDTATTSTGDALSTVGTASQSFTITVAAPVVLGAWAGGPEDAATQGRAIGGGTGGALDYPITNGIGPFTCSQTGLPGGSGLAVALNGANCRLAGTPNATDTAASPLTVIITVTDTGSGLTANATTAAFDVFAPLNLNGSTGAAATLYPASVVARLYSFAVAVAGGNQNGVVTLTNPGAALNAGNCVGLSLTPPSISGTPSFGAPPVTCTFDLAIADTTTNMSGTATLTQTANTIAVNAPLTLTPAAPGGLVNGVVGLAYNNGAPVVFSVTGGLPPYAFFDPSDAPFTGACTPTGNFPPGLTFPTTSTATTANLSGTPSLHNMGAPASYVFELCVQDTPNAAVVTADANTQAGFDIAVMQPLAFGVAPGDNTLQVVRTAPIAATGNIIERATTITLADTGPHTAAVTANGREVWVSMAGNNSIERYDTVTFAALAPILLSAGTFAGPANECLGPRGIVHGVPGSNSAGLSYVGCSVSNRIVVINTAAGTFNAALATGGGTNPTDLAITPDGSRVYATLETADLALVTTPATVSTIAGVAANSTNGGIDIAADGSRLVVADNTTNQEEFIIVAIPAHTTTTVGLANGDIPRGVAFDPTGTRIYVALEGPNVLSVRNGTTGALVTAVNVHTAVITTATRTGGTATITTATEHGLVDNQEVNITGVSQAAFNVNNAVVTVTSPTTFTFALAGTTAGTGGNFVAVGTDPFGLIIPPTDGTVRVITVLNGNGTFAPERFVVHDESAAPTRTAPNQAGLIAANPFDAVAASSPTRIAYIPRPR